MEVRGETRLDAALKRVPVAGGRGVCVLISDLLTDGWETGVSSLLYRRQQVSVLQMMAPQELAPEFSGALRLMDSEGGPSCDVQVSADALKRYGEVLAGFLEERAAFCYRRGIGYGLVSSGMELEGELLRTLVRAGVVLGR